MADLHVCTCGTAPVVDAAGVDCPHEGCGALIGASCRGPAGEALDRAHEERARLAVAESQGCAVVPFRDVCRFEQALADPVQAQLDAAAAVIERYLDDGYGSLTADKIAREALAAAAIVVLGRPPCTSCGRPLGTGTLADHSPTMPKGERLMGGEVVTVPELEANDWFLLASPEAWPEFAARYRCPACAQAVPDAG